VDIKSAMMDVRKLLNKCVTCIFIICYIFEISVHGQDATHFSTVKAKTQKVAGDIHSTRNTMKTQKISGDIHNHLVMNESEYGYDMHLRPVEKMKPERNSPCERRKGDNKFACFPDIIYIGTSKSGTTSMAAHLAYHPMLQNILSKEVSTRRKSKEGHFWEMEKNTRNATDPLNWLLMTKEDIINSQEGFRTEEEVQNRPVLIEYSPNYFVLDHLPQTLKSELNYKVKFIVSLREPVSRTLSSWKFKAKECLKLAKCRDDHFNETISQGIQQAQCIADCYWKKKSMQDCSIEECRRKHDRRRDGRNGKYSYYAHVVKSLYAYQFLMWFEYFPKSSFFIFTIEQYRKNPIGVTEAILDFMGLPLYDSSGKNGFKDKKALIDILSVVMNETPVSSALENQINKETLDNLRNFFVKEDKVLKEVLGWDKGYYT